MKYLLMIYGNQEALLAAALQTIRWVPGTTMAQRISRAKRARAVPGGHPAHPLAAPAAAG